MEKKTAKDIEEKTDKSAYGFGLKNAKALLKPISTVNEYLDEAKFEVSEDGVHLQQSDRTMVVIVEMQLKKKAFSELSGSGEFSVDMSTFSDMVKRFGDSPMSVSQKEGWMIMAGANKKFELRELQKVQGGMPPVDQLEYDAEWTVDGVSLTTPITLGAWRHAH